ncbi:Beta-TrCP [Dactylella cylindrospora]|nr:Beta-TrCP [Dactylella cylindrospora]
MFNAHRGHVPAPAPSRFNEILDQLRAEFDAQIARGTEYEHKVNGQMQEMEMIQRAVFSLENSHQQMKQKYEEEISRLTRELEKYSGQAPSHAGPSQNAGSSSQPPPQLNHGPGILFGTIMSGGQQGPGISLADPQAQQSQQQQPQQGPPTSGGPHQTPQGPHGHPIHPPQPPLSQTPQGGQQPPQPGSYPPQSSGFPNNGGFNAGSSSQAAPPPSASPTPSGVRPNKGAPGPAPSRPGPPPQVPSVAPPYEGSNLDIDRIPSNQKKEGTDWFAYFNPRVPRVLDVDLVHTLEHNSVVCCVRFSQDGRYVATGCNRSAQIFDVSTGKRVTLLQDDTVDREGDLYIRSVCFSPDGRYLATGAEDKQIRVWDIANKTIRYNFVGHEQDIYSLDFSKNGRHIASGSGDRTVRIWDMEQGQNTLTLSIEDGVTTVAISPDGQFVAAGSLDKSVRVWDISSGRLVERLEGPDGHKDSVYSVAFAPNGRDLVSGSLDKTIKMWELSSARGLPPPGATPKGGNCVKTFEGHRVSISFKFGLIKILLYW